MPFVTIKKMIKIIILQYFDILSRSCVKHLHELKPTMKKYQSEYVYEILVLLLTNTKSLNRKFRFHLLLLTWFCAECHILYFLFFCCLYTNFELLLSDLIFLTTTLWLLILSGVSNTLYQSHLVTFDFVKTDCSIHCHVKHYRNTSNSPVIFSQCVIIFLNSLLSFWNALI